MTKSVVIMDQHFRQLEELFRPATFGALQETCTVIGGVNWPLPKDHLATHLSHAEFLIAATPSLTRTEIDMAPHLKAVIEVAGTFQTGIDYQACFDRGIEVLSCAPGFRYSVAEMTLGLILAGARGIVDEHERFRNGSERWLHDNSGTDFSLYGQTIGFVGYGSIARETARLLAPFSPQIKAFDPWLKAAGTIRDVAFCDLEETVTTCRCVVVAATPTEDNYHLVSRDLIGKIPHGTLVVVVSRAHLVDFDALLQAADAGRLRIASDVFPHEPVSKRDALRQADNVIWSPHRAAAVDGGRHPIGDMILHDIRAIQSGHPDRQLQAASLENIQKIIRAPMVAR
ncbi:NAD(P)-dependent oxidoreductase [uncultured Tateyamaria sp.]|uniref:NAD(P)-dependent oxidoreductase n=1 Tax=uncultured Tateyamaria sp. TaxID=455651 RepID=UPI00260D1652|nr:NAD(P)-dependent oxidoreductase [uncultured Tateyamaria sp.]